MTRGSLLVGAALMLGAASVSGQTMTAGLAGAHARYADSLSGTAALANLRFRAATLHHFYDLEGSVSRFTSGEWVAQFGGRGAALVQIGRGWRAGVAGAATLNGFEGGPLSGIGSGGPVVAVGGLDWLVLGTVGIGGARAIDGGHLSLTTGTLTFRWLPSGTVFVDAALTGTGSEDLRYGDLALGSTVTGATWRLSAGLGARTGDLGNVFWGDLRGELRPWGRWTFEAAAGRYPPDVTGFTAGVYGLLGVRVAVFGSAVGARPGLSRRSSAVQVERVNGALVRITLRRAGAVERLTIAGEFNDWQELELTREGDGRWSLVLALTPGVHRYALVADGEWTLPDGVDGISDDFGGRVGLLVVPAPAR